MSSLTRNRHIHLFSIPQRFAPSLRKSKHLKPFQQLYKQEDAKIMFPYMLPECPICVLLLCVNPVLISLYLLPLFDICVVFIMFIEKIKLSTINNLAIVLNCSFWWSWLFRSLLPKSFYLALVTCNWVWMLLL